MKDAEKLEKMLEIKEIIDSGYAGIMPNGNIVDTREKPQAIPIPENTLMKTPKPKQLTEEE